MLGSYPGCSQPSSIRRIAGVAQATTAAAEDAGPAAVAAASTATSGDSTLSELSVEDPTSFLDLGVDPLLLSGLAETGIEVPSPIQEAAIPVLLSGRNAAIQSYTGSGKVRRVAASGTKCSAWQGRAECVLQTMLPSSCCVDA
jgi:hypothetical protein